MRRRDLIALIGGAAVAWPITSRAQHSIPVIGFLNSTSREGYAPFLAAFLKGLNEAGYVEDRNVRIEYRWAEGHYDRLPALVTDLTQHQVTVLAATSTLAALAAKAAALTIPVVFTTSGDPVKLGLTDNLNRPNRNITGATQLGGETGPKRLELLHELLPEAKVVAFLNNPANPLAETLSNEMELASRVVGLQLHLLNASSDNELDAAFASLSGRGIGGLVTATDPYFASRAGQLAALAVRHRMPTIDQNREFAAAGGLISYGGDIRESYHIAGIYTGRILKGERPENLPVQQVTRVEMIINLKAAKALGIAIPLSLSGRADELIE